MLDAIWCGMDSLYFGGSGAMEILQIEEIAESDKLQEQAKPAYDLENGQLPPAAKTPCRDNA